VAIQVYRCTRCGREVLVRIVAPLTEEQVRRRVEEEMRPPAPGPTGPRGLSERLRDDIWIGLSNQRTPIPREEPPDRCPTCAQDSLALDRVLED
jgi:hypothetical protein